jgi:acetylornithine deacetylase/succinyl-diaminopimelate desuccinylase-like protein
MDAKKLVQKLIQIDSQCVKSNKRIVDFVAGFFPKRISRIVKLKKGGLDLYNLQVKFDGGKHDKPLIFSGHTDTVPLQSGWIKDPFGGEIVGNRIYGLGASDMKAGLAAMILAALSIKKRPKQDVWFLFDADEESGGYGGQDFVRRLQVRPRSARVIIAEPTDCALEIGQKGVCEFEIIFCGKAFHSSLTDYSKNREFNAIHKAFQVFKKFEQVERALLRKKMEPFSSPSLTVCQMNGGIAANVIPDSCKMIVSRRFLPCENMENEIAKIIRLIKQTDPTAKIRIKFRGDSNMLDSRSRLLKKAKIISREVFGQEKIIVAQGWTQAGFYKKWGDCLIWGPGEKAMCHQKDEYCNIQKLAPMVECYKKLIETNV